MATTISSVLLLCLKQFNELLEADQKIFQEIPHQLWQDESGRLRLWAANIGAHQKGQSSLDYRLRDASHIKNHVIRLLERYHDVLREAHSHLRPRVFDEGLQEDDFMDDDFSSGDDYETEAQSIYKTLLNLMNSLFKMSTTIRCPAQHDRILKSRREDSQHFEQYDRAHVVEKYPHADKIIIDRLGAAISRRRRDLKYRERHHQKLSQGLDAAISGIGEDQADAVSSTVATELQTTQADAGKAASDSGVTQTSVAPSLFDPKKDVTIPNPPTASEGESYFQCPYCYIVISIKDRKDWARHVFLDILPYVCVFKECAFANRLYGLRREWSRHISECHGKLENATEPPGTCHLCQVSVLQMNTAKVQRHVGRHLEDLALFAVPRNDEDVQADNEEERSDGDRISQSSMSSGKLVSPEGSIRPDVGFSNTFDDAMEVFEDPTIVQGAQATSAAPSYFDPVTIEGETFVDVVLPANSPAPERRDFDSIGLRSDSPSGALTSEGFGATATIDRRDKLLPEDNRPAEGAGSQRHRRETTPVDRERTSRRGNPEVPPRDALIQVNEHENSDSGYEDFSEDEDLRGIKAIRYGDPHLSGPRSPKYGVPELLYPHEVRQEDQRSERCVDTYMQEDRLHDLRQRELDDRERALERKERELRMGRSQRYNY